MEQNSFDWLLWRRGGIGSSDSPIILGLSPYSTPLDCYEDKVSTDPPSEKSNYILECGKRAEPKIRAMFEIRMEMEFAPKLVQMEQFPYLRASLDGRSIMNEIAEFKLVGRESFDRTVKEKHIPEHYRIQIQKQLLVSQAKRAWYVPFNGKIITQVEVLPDLPMQEKIFESDINFWNNHVLKRKPPEPCERDFKTLRAKGLTKKLERWKQLRIQIEELETEKEEIEEWAKELIKDEIHPRWVAGNVAFNRVTRKGNVDYSKIPELKDVDLEQYRKGSIKYTEMRILK